jgi:hypothetical protein
MWKNVEVLAPPFLKVDSKGGKNKIEISFWNY